MHAYAYAHKKSDKNYPSVGMRLVRNIIPPRHGPENQGGEQTGHGINLSLYRTEPEGIGEAVDKRPHKARAHNRKSLGSGVFFIFRAYEPFCKPNYGKIKKEDG